MMMQITVGVKIGGVGDDSDEEEDDKDEEENDKEDEGEEEGEERVRKLAKNEHKLITRKLANYIDCDQCQTYGKCTHFLSWHQLTLVLY